MTDAPKHSAPKEYRVRVRPRPKSEWPASHDERLEAAGIRYTRISGKAPKTSDDIWLILGHPIKPSSGWVCGADVIWPVLAVEGKKDFEMHGVPHVCRHMIQIGD